MFNGISVWWHLAGVAVIIGILIVVPDNHASFNTVFTDRINNSGFSQSMFWWYVLPLGFLLTQYTITGFDASAHISEETHDSENAAPKGVWRSVFWSAVIGYIVLLAITFAAADPKRGHRGRRRLAGRVPGRDVDRLGEGDPHHRRHRAAVLRHELHDQLVAHDVRVLARRGGAGLAALEQGQRRSGSRSTRSSPSRCSR